MRVFLAIFPTPEVQKKLFTKILKIKTQFPEIKWVNKYQNLHLTLKFLGENNNKKISKINKVVLNSIGNSYKNFVITLYNIGFLPNIKKPKVIYVGIKEQMENLKQLKINLDNGLKKLNFMAEKNFTTHLTLGRIKSKTNIFKLKFALNIFAEEEFKIKVNSIFLMQSIITSAGPLYKEIKKFSLE